MFSGGNSTVRHVFSMGDVWLLGRYRVINMKTHFVNLLFSRRTEMVEGQVPRTTERDFATRIWMTYRYLLKK